MADRDGSDQLEGLDDINGYDPKEVVKLPRKRIVEIRKEARENARQEIRDVNSLQHQEREKIREQAREKAETETKAKLLEKHIDKIDSNINSLEQRMTRTSKAVESIVDVVEKNEQEIYVVPPDTDVDKHLKRVWLTSASFAASLAVLSAFFSFSAIQGVSIAFTVALVAPPLVQFLWHIRD
ncbi:hypothetical protein [Halolamina salina]|uniref:Uncharacterized protein n=1 Tax=Halolamina salina TaxID=1220023 RepID=A0ABD6B6Z2_9EURY